MAEQFDRQKVWFVRPVGDISLITLKGYRILQQADIVIYAGSLINTDLLDYCKDGVESYDSAAMTLDDIITVMVDGVKSHKLVVRLQTGDLSCTALSVNRAKCWQNTISASARSRALVPSSVPQPNWVWNTPYRKYPRA